MNVEGIEFPDDCLYEGSGSYLWAKQEGENIRIGLTNLGLKLAGDIVYIELPGVGDSVAAGEPFGVVETVKATAELNSPVSGEVVETNEGATDDPSSLADNSWFIVVKSSDVSGLMDAKAAEEYYKGEIEKAKGEGLLE